MGIHREGRNILIFSALLFAALSWGALYLFPTLTIVAYLIIAVLAIIYIWFLWFFRIPVIEINKSENAILSPADGKVVVIERNKETEYLNEERIQISVFMSPLNVHQNRTPVEGSVEYYRYHKGKFLFAWDPKSSTENERTTLVMNTGSVKILFRQIAGIMARRIKCYVQEGDSLGQGDEFGFIRFGSRVDTFVPVDAEIKVKSFTMLSRPCLSTSEKSARLSLSTSSTPYTSPS